MPHLPYTTIMMEVAMEDVKRILVMSRSTSDCRKAVHYGISLARMCGAELTILHVMYDPFFLRGGMAYVPFLKALQQEYRAMMEKARYEIDEMVHREKADGMHIREMVEAAEPVHEIVKVVEAEKIDVLILAAHDETRIEHVVYGRVNHEIVRRLPCSVFLVKGE
jgi:nucleotide-binding universal stress UspA family protein